MKTFTCVHGRQESACRQEDLRRIKARRRLLLVLDLDHTLLNSCREVELQPHLPRLRELHDSLKEEVNSGYSLCVRVRACICT